MNEQAVNVPETETAQPDRIAEIRANNRKVRKRMEELCPDFLKWMPSTLRCGYGLVGVAVMEELKEREATFRVTLFTSRREYRITVRPSRTGMEAAGPDAEGYLGGSMSVRKSRAGEDWMRGCDLADGPYSKGTWDEIVSGIVVCELVRLGE